MTSARDAFGGLPPDGRRIRWDECQVGASIVAGRRCHADATVWVRRLSATSPK